MLLRPEEKVQASQQGTEAKGWESRRPEKRTRMAQ